MKKIAVVEDNPDNRLLVRVILEPQYEVSEYANGQSTLEGLAREKPDLLLLDISLPEMDGVAVLRRIRANAGLRDLPVIALTAHAMAGDREKYLGLGFDDYVTKPIVDEKVLLDAIQRNLVGGQRAPAAAPQQPCCVASGTVEQLRKLGGDSFAAEMIGVFLEYVARKIAQGREAYAAGDLVGVENAVHPIKSSSGNVGARQIQELAVRIEDLARNRQSEALGPLLVEIDSAFGLAKPEFERIRQSLLKQ
jgi:CheY-like chemotaxis protein/HPt (histidine-containing phosphotransfer) domain-containing protein